MRSEDYNRFPATTATSSAGLTRRQLVVVGLLTLGPLPLLSLAAAVVSLPDLVQRAATELIPFTTGALGPNERVVGPRVEIDLAESSVRPLVARERPSTTGTRPARRPSGPRTSPRPPHATAPTASGTSEPVQPVTAPGDGHDPGPSGAAEAGPPPATSPSPKPPPPAAATPPAPPPPAPSPPFLPPPPTVQLPTLPPPPKLEPLPVPLPPLPLPPVLDALPNLPVGA